MLNMLIVLSPDGEMKMANKATCDLLVYSEDELIGKPTDILIQGGVATWKVWKMRKYVTSNLFREKISLTKKGSLFRYFSQDL